MKNANPKVKTIANTDVSKSERIKTKESFPIVGIGASAGGLEAFQQLLHALPVDMKMAFVLVQHLDPKHESALTVILKKSTPMPVLEVKDAMKVELAHVYIIPPNTDLSLSDGHLKLLPRSLTRGQHMPVNSFLTSLAKVKRENAIGVILSGPNHSF